MTDKTCYKCGTVLLETGVNAPQMQYVCPECAPQRVLDLIFKPWPPEKNES